MANTTGRKYGGRQKGTPNKITNELRKKLKIIVSDELDNIGEILNELEAKERLDIVIKLMPFVFPKLKQEYYNIGEPSKFGLDIF